MQKANPRVKIRATSDNSVLYEATVTAAIDAYPSTLAGRRAFEADVLAGKLVRTLDNGVVIPVGTVTPKVPPAPGGSGSLPSIDYGLILGNSLLRSGPLAGTDWQFTRGMAATADNKDYYSLIRTEFQKVNPNFSLFAANQGAGLEQVYLNNNDDVTNNISNILSDFTAQSGSSAKLKYIYVSLGENVDNDRFDPVKMRSMLDRVLAALPKASNPILVFRNSVWGGKDRYNSFIQGYAADKGGLFVDMASVRENSAYMNTGAWQNAGVDHHLNDAGMARFTTLSLAPVRGTSAGGGTLPPTTGAFQNPNTNYVAVANQNWLNADEVFFESSTMRIGILNAGGVISTARFKSNGRGLVNTAKVYYDENPSDPRYQKTVYDLGRSIMPSSLYMTPGPEPLGYVFKNGKSTKTGFTGRPGSNGQGQHIFNTGCNTVQGGSLWPALDKSPILASARYTHQTRGDEVYIQTRPMIWGVSGETGHVVVEQWLSWAAPNVLRIYARHTIEERDPARVDEQRTFQALEQETPCMYLIAPLTQHLINLPGESRKNIQPGANPLPRFSSTYHVPDNKIGAYEGDGGVGVTYYSPRNSSVKSGQVGSGGYSTDGDEYSQTASYLNGAVRRNFDNAGIYDDESYIIFGTESEANAAIANLPGIDQSFAFNFANEDLSWWNVDSRLKRETGNNWTWYLDSKTDNNVTSFLCKFMAPYRAWQASGIARISFDMEVSGASQFDLIWSKPGADNGPEYARRFNVTGDGQRRTYTIETFDTNWNGIISSVGLKAVTGSTNNGAKVIIRNIYKS